MQAIEFETTAHNHIIQIPDSVPDGVNLRVLVLMDETVAAPSKTNLKNLLTNLTESLTPPHNDTRLTTASAFGLIKTPITATLEDIEQGIIAGATHDND